MQRLNDVKQYKVKLLDMGRKIATQFLISCKVSIHRIAPAAACE